ncbi:MAG: hypothetical protein ACYC2K_05725 [Gemmatimonadales bacterium]
MSDNTPTPVATLDRYRVEWLYAHFKGISAAGNRYLTLLLTVTALSLATFFSTASGVKAPGLDVAVEREMLLAASGLIGTILCIAYFGSYDKGAQALLALSDALGCEYGDMWLADPTPNVIDFVRYVHPDAAAKRVLWKRALEAMLYPIALVVMLTWFTVLSTSAVFLGTHRDTWVYVGAVGMFAAFVGWKRAEPFGMARWRTFRATEKERVRAASEVEIGVQR